MGVRESCEGGGELNIHDFVVENETKRETPFDANTEILSEEWNKIREWIKTTAGGTSDPITDMGAPAKFIFPDKNLIPDLKNSRNMFGSHYRPIVTDSAFKVAGGFDAITLQHDLALKSVIPDYQYYLDDPKNWKKFLELLDKEATKPKKHNAAMDPFLLSILRDAKISYPKRIENLGLEKFEEYIVSGNRNLAEEAHQEGQWCTYARCLASARLLYPEQMKDYKIDETAWEGMRRTLDNALHARENPDWHLVLDMALNIQVLAAKDVVFDEKGMHLVMPLREEKFQEKIPSRPERKQF